MRHHAMTITAGTEDLVLAGNTILRHGDDFAATNKFATVRGSSGHLLCCCWSRCSLGNRSRLSNHSGIDHSRRSDLFDWYADRYAGGLLDHHWCRNRCLGIHGNVDDWNIVGHGGHSLHVRLFGKYRNQAAIGCSHFVSSDSLGRGDIGGHCLLAGLHLGDDLRSDGAISWTNAIDPAVDLDAFSSSLGIGVFDESHLDIAGLGFSLHDGAAVFHAPDLGDDSFFRGVVLFHHGDGFAETLV